MKARLGSNRPLRLTRIALSILITSLFVSALIGITVILIGRFDETGMRILATAATLAGFSVVSLPSLFHLERGGYQNIALLGVLASFIVFVLVLLVIWGEGIFDDEVYLKVLTTVGVIAFSINHILLMLIATPTKFVVLVCQRVTTLVITAVAVLILIVIWTGNIPDGMVRIFAILGVLDALGTIVMPLLVRMSRPRGLKAT